MLKMIGLLDGPALSKNIGSRSAFSKNNNSRPASGRNNSNGEVDGFGIGRNGVKHAKESKNQKAKKHLSVEI